MSPLAQMIQLVVLTSLALGAVYFIFYRPTVNAQTRQRRIVAGLKPGDEVVTTGGLIARLVEVVPSDDGDEELVLDLGGGQQVRALPSAIVDRRRRPDAVPPAPDADADADAAEVSEDSAAELATAADADEDESVASPVPADAAPRPTRVVRRRQ